MLHNPLSGRRVFPDFTIIYVQSVLSFSVKVCSRNLNLIHLQLTGYNLKLMHTWLFLASSPGAACMMLRSSLPGMDSIDLILLPHTIRDGLRGGIKDGT